MSDFLPFTPVPVRARRDGWTPARQGAFIAALADSRCVTAAARVAGMSWQSAYRLRDRPDAAGFARAWDAALRPPALPDGFTGRAMGGVARPIMWRGRQVGERRRYDDRLARYILRTRTPDRFGTAAEHRRAPAPDPFAAIARLEADLAAGTAPCDEADFPGDVARTSSPSAGRDPHGGRELYPRAAVPSPIIASSRAGRRCRPPMPGTLPTELSPRPPPGTTPPLPHPAGLC